MKRSPRSIRQDTNRDDRITLDDSGAPAISAADGTGLVILPSRVDSVADLSVVPVRPAE